MIALFKNQEIQKPMFIQVTLAAIATAVCFYINTYTGWIILLLSVALILIYCFFTYKRYQQFSALAHDINKLLHGDDSITFENYSEGELGILHSEIYKMTIRLREQQQNLTKDKTYLADSIADISHQIRTPLTSINLLVQLLSNANLSNERRQQIVHELYTLLSRIEWLITALLKISKLDAGTIQFKQETIPLEQLITQSCSPLLVPIELRDQELLIDAEGDFAGDISWTCESISNIVKNCMEHTAPGGKIEITARENALYSEIQIQDNGTGIAQEDLPHIFERFYKGKNSDDKSFGVGLALSRMIITQQNGTIKAENRQNKGAKFTIRFYKGTV